MQVRILETPQALEPYRAEWSAPTAPTPFATWETYQRCLAHHPPTTRPFVLVVLDDTGRLIALAPWIKRTDGGVRRLSGLQDAWYQDPLFFQPERAREAARAIVSELKRACWRWDLLDLNVQEALTAPLMEELPRLGPMHVERIDGWQTRIIRLGEDWDAYWKERSSQLRRNVQRAEKHVAQVPHRFFAAASNDVVPLLDEVFQRHARRWIPTAQRNWEGYYAMYRAIVERALERQELNLHVLEIEGQTAALDLSIVHGEGCYGLLKIYDPAFSSYRPGHLLTKWTLRRLFDQGFRQFDPGGGDDEWKEAFMTQRLSTVQPLIASPASPLGLALVTWKGRLRPWLHESRWLVSFVKGLRQVRRPPRQLPEPLPT